MIQRFIDDVRVATGTAARQTFFIGAVAISLFITTLFLCAAAFVVMLQKFGLVEACLTGAAIFFILTLITAGTYIVTKRSAAKRVVKETKSATQSFIPDPMMLATGLQVARAIGFKRILPILAIGGLALGILAARQASGGTNASDEAQDQES